jgi:hypothetical protein
MAEIVNLKRARKAKERATKERRAQENRAKFGLSKAERERSAKLDELAAKRLDGAKRGDDE